MNHSELEKANDTIKKEIDACKDLTKRLKEELGDEDLDSDDGEPYQNVGALYKTTGAMDSLRKERGTFSYKFKPEEIDK